MFFRPDAGKVQGPLYWIGAGCLVVAAIAGVAGAVFIALGASGLAAGTGPNGWWFALSAIAAYILLAWATAHFWNRPITTELLLFVAWGALEAGTGPNGWWFALSAIAAYILLAWATAHFWNRPITTELLLFVAWGALELYATCALEAGGTLGLTATWCLVAIIFCVFALSLTCYVLYYRLAATPSFIAGALPLGVVGIFSAILPLLL